MHARVYQELITCPYISNITKDVLVDPEVITMSLHFEQFDGCIGCH